MKKTATKRSPRTKPMLPPPMEDQNAPVVANKRTVDDAVQSIMTTINSNHYASGRATRAEATEFFKQIRDACNLLLQIEGIQEELDQEDK